jgi:hypothetical protein
MSLIEKVYHPLHESEYKTMDSAARKLSGIGAKYQNTSVHSGRQSKVYKHPEHGTFTAIDYGKKTKIYHFPMSVRKSLADRIDQFVDRQYDRFTPKVTREDIKNRVDMLRAKKSSLSSRINKALDLLNSSEVA